jgi:hypothetical protein
LEDIGNRCGEKCRMLTRMPDALAGAMGNQVCIAAFNTLDEVEEFVKYAYGPIECASITRW